MNSAQKSLETQQLIVILSDILMTSETFMDASEGNLFCFSNLLPKHLHMG